MPGRKERKKEERKQMYEVMIYDSTEPYYHTHLLPLELDQVPPVLFRQTDLILLDRLVDFMEHPQELALKCVRRTLRRRRGGPDAGRETRREAAILGHALWLVPVLSHLATRHEVLGKGQQCLLENPFTRQYNYYA